MSFEFLAGLVLAHGYLVVFLAVALDCAALQRQWASAMTFIQIALAVALVGFVMVRSFRSRWLRLALGAALLALFSLRATTMMTEETQPAPDLRDASSSF